MALARLLPLRVAVPLNEDDKRRAIVRFWQLYWGQLALVESPEVASAMVAFKEVLQDISLSEEIGEKALKRHSINLARECRDSLKESWNVELLEIKKS